MPRRLLLNVLAVLSLLLCLAVVALWVRSYRVRDDYYRDSQARRGNGWRVHAWSVSSSRGAVRFLLFRQDFPNPSFPSPPAGDFVGVGRSQRVRGAPLPLYERPDRLTSFFDCYQSPIHRGSSYIGGPAIRFAHWVPLALLTPAAGLLTYRAARQLVRAAPGVCATCGYDLRATPSRCPECGTNAARPPPTEGVTPILP